MQNLDDTMTCKNKTYSSYQEQSVEIQNKWVLFHRIIRSFPNSHVVNCQFPLIATGTHAAFSSVQLEEGPPEIGSIGSNVE